MTTLPSIQPLIPLPSNDHSRKPIAQPQPIQPRTNPLDEADINRFATLFSPATPPATPTPIFRDHYPTTTRPQHHRNRTGSTDSEFGAFVSVPAAQDPLSFDFQAPEHPTSVPSGNNSLDYFDQFTSSAKTASEQSRRVVLDELLAHEDDPLYFLQAHDRPPSPPTSEIRSASPQASIVWSPPSIPQSNNLIDIKPPSPPPLKLPILTPSIPSQSPVTARTPLPPRITGAVSPPSGHSPPTSSASLPFPSSSSTPPAHATLSRLSSSWVSSLLPSGRSRQSTALPAATHASTIVHSAPGSVFQSTPPSHTHIPRPTPGITRGTPFATQPYIPPSGAPGFAGDRTWDKGFSDTLEDEEMSEVKGVLRKAKKGKGIKLVGRREGTVGVLSEDIANLIRPHLPALTRLPRTWTLLYSLDQHGISLNTLYSRCEPKVPSAPGATKGALVVVRDARDAIFGAWMGDGLWLERAGYYGSGESFLWKYHPHPSSKDAEDGFEEDTLDVYKWTGRNDYVALCEPGFISFGGGDGHYGLYLDASLLDGSSAPCPTFDNPVLCSRVDGGGRGSKKDVSFECVGLEVWGVGP
ncbi:TLD-domain-containing protein [Rhizopogon vinicolor AM-OR11-026]|uniref:Oxidation resistance protein 1 n=1 Tax=Rhizopogon vinicolor AM-OR11-026 TaxID=1314800 RepID=A0A1B7MTY6_9AGAM|nr:TLD-domain-containing protein [Rhizopogon vinicolor AM-OR11-026]